MTPTADQMLQRARKAARRGATAEAVRLYGEVLARFPANKRAAEGLKRLRTQAGAASHQAEIAALAALYRRGDLAAVLTRARVLAERFPGVGMIPNLEGAALVARGDWTAAEAAFRRAIAAEPTMPEAHNNLGNVLKAADQAEDALACYRQALALRPGYPEARNNLANALSQLGRFAEAETEFKAALAQRPDFAEAENNLGTVLTSLGRAPEAEACFDRAIALAPGYAQAYRNKSNLKTYCEGDPEIGRMTALIENHRAGDEDRMHLGFALAKALDEIGQTDRAFEVLAKANELRRRALAYDPEADRSLFGTIRSGFEAPLPAVETAPPAESKAPILIVGMPRSGTTLVEQMLATHRQVHGAGELQFLRRAAQHLLKALRADGPMTLTAERLAEFRDRYLDDLDTLGTDRMIVTDKMPENFRWAGFLLAAMPSARVINLARDPVAVGWSIYRHYFHAEGVGYAYDLGDIAAYIGLYNGLMARWRQVFPGRIHDVDYEALTEDPEAVLRPLFTHCGLDWDPNCLEFHANRRPVATASALQVRQRLYTGSSSAWRRYEHHLRPLIDALAAETSG